MTPEPAAIGRRGFLRCAGAAAAALAGAGLLAAETPNERPPNVVVIFTDDQGYGDLGCYGSKTIKTPNLDAMAAGGMKFTDFYSAAPACTPSRAALLTGCYPLRVGLPRVLFPWNDTGIHDDEITIAEILKARGYATCCVGKWHLGHHKQFLPTRHGFDEYFGLPYSNDMRPKAGKRYPPLPLIDGETVFEKNPDQSQLTRRYTERAVKFITQHKDRLFFLYLPHSMPHVPLFASAAFKGKSAGGLYGDVIEELDWSVGEILRTLKRLDIDDRTLVIFTSDNGPWLIMKDRGGSAGPLRQGKGTTYEGGMREPCIMRWPGKIPAGKVCGEVASTIDLLPTLAGLAGAAAPKDRVIDGRDIRPLMAGRDGAASPHKAFFYYRYVSLEAVRCGRWKLRIGRSRWDKGKGAELYDLQTDVGESKNLAAQRQDLVAQMRARMKIFDKQLRARARPVGRLRAAKARGSS